MQLPAHFTEKIVLIFGDRGRAWLEQVPQLLASAADRWRLTNLRLATGLSYNLICFAESPDHGPVALKLATDPDDIRCEREVLSLYAGRGFCRCLDADAERGILLLERLEPGFDLRTVTDLDERFRIAADLFTSLPVAPAPGHQFPTYRDWITRAFRRVRLEHRVGPAFLAMVDVAERYWEEIDSPDRPRVLLHGDLHHMNILYDRQGGWKAIDPKGVIGVPCMGAARFMQNEFGFAPLETRMERLDQMASLFGARLGEPKELLVKCLLVEHVLANCWNAEEAVVPATIRTAVAECELLLG